MANEKRQKGLSIQLQDYSDHRAETYALAVPFCGPLIPYSHTARD
jgi:hypothetical protein